MKAKHQKQIYWHGWTFDRVTPDQCPGFIEYDFSGNNDFLTIKISSKIDETENEKVLVSVESIFLNKELFIECNSVEMALKCLDLEMKKAAKALKAFLKFVEPS